MNNDKNYQNHFYNIDGIEILTKELRSSFTEDNIKEIDDKIKQLKNNKSAQFFKDNILVHTQIPYAIVEPLESKI